MRRAFAVSCGIAVIGALMLMAFGLIGSHVNSDGILREPFALLPIGVLLLALGGIGGVASLVMLRLRPSRTR
mgnify:CR=1 FL=1